MSGFAFWICIANVTVMTNMGCNGGCIGSIATACIAVSYVSSNLTRSSHDSVVRKKKHVAAVNKMTLS